MTRFRPAATVKALVGNFEQRVIVSCVACATSDSQTWYFVCRTSWLRNNTAIRLRPCCEDQLASTHRPDRARGVTSSMIWTHHHPVILACRHDQAWPHLECCSSNSCRYGLHSPRRLSHPPANL